MRTSRIINGSATAAIIVTLALMGCAHAPTAASLKTGPGQFFISPGGNDKWSGQLPQANAAKTDGPFASLEKAREAVRAFKNRTTAQETITVTLRGGDYFLPKPLDFSTEDSGTSDAPIRYLAAPGEEPVLSGGRKISGWKQMSRDGKTLWAATVPEVREGKWSFHQIWVNGERAVRARHPNKGYLAVDEIPDAKSNVAWTVGQGRFRFKSDDIKAWPSIANAEVRVMNRWVESHLPVMKVDEAERMIMFSKKSVFKLEPGDLYYLEHAFEALDQPGEWYLDKAEGMLYYMPRSGEDMTQAVVIAPVLSQLVRFEGSSTEGKFVSHLQFHGIRFSHTEWYFPGGFDTGPNKAEVWPPPKAEVGGFAQAAVGVSGAIWGEGLRNVTFEKCGFRNLGGYAVELTRGCRDNRFSYCDVGNLGAGGFKLGETAIRQKPDEITCNNEISDCHIHDGGLLFHSAIGIWIGQSPGNKLVHNHIHDFYYSGISIGWTWGYSAALATNNLVEWNHVHHIGVRSDGDGPILSDMAGIYTLGLHEGSAIRNNIWHDVAGLRYGGWGIYFDEGTTRILAENNLVYRTTHGGFHQHYGKENVVRNNIFAYARDFQIQRSRAEAHLSYNFSNNIVLFNRGKLLEGNFSGTNYQFQSNLYWKEDGTAPRFDKWTFAEWQNKGLDSHGLVADPLFNDVRKDDFSLKPGSPAEKIGFKPFDLKSVGVRK